MSNDSEEIRDRPRNPILLMWGVEAVAFFMWKTGIAEPNPISVVFAFVAAALATYVGVTLASKEDQTARVNGYIVIAINVIWFCFAFFSGDFLARS